MLTDAIDIRRRIIAKADLSAIAERSKRVASLGAGAEIAKGCALVRGVSPRAAYCGVHYLFGQQNVIPAQSAP